MITAAGPCKHAPRFAGVLRIWATAACVAIAFLCLEIASVAMESTTVLRPDVDHPEAAREPAGTDTMQPHASRVGPVVFDAGFFLPVSPVSGKRVVAADSFRGRQLSLAFFPDQNFQVVIGFENRPQSDVISMNGNLSGSSLSTFSLTVTPESFLMTLQVLETASVFRVVGQTDTGLGQALEIDLTNTPPIWYTPPLVPPAR